VNKRIIAAAALVAGLLVQTQGFTQVPISTDTSASTVADAGKMSDPEKAARKSWRAVMRNTPVPGTGCFHVKYPNVAWESVECKVAKPRAHPLPVNRTVGAPGAGNGTDYVAQAQGLISFAAGKFFISGVTSETNVAGPNTPSNPCAPTSTCKPILGPNEYSLQINTNNNPTTNHTAACGDYSGCYVWQQFMYGTDYNCQPSGSACGEGALFMQYWLYNWPGPSSGQGPDPYTCPHGWWGPDYGYLPSGVYGWYCYKNSDYTPVPNIPVTNLGDVILSANAVNGGDDTIWLEYGDDSWARSNADSSAPCCKGGLDIASVWNQAEFNVVGDMDSTQAQFNFFSSITVVLAILDGSDSAPTCPNNVGTTGETNNMTLGACQTGVGNVIDLGGCGNQTACVGEDIYGPYIEFTESFYPSIPCLRFCGASAEVRPTGTASLR
jgi:hypothetical protein